MLHKKIIKTHYHIVLPMFLVVFLTVGVFIVVVQSQKNQILNTQTTTTNCTVASSQLTIKTQEQQLFSDINTYRSRQGVAQLAWSTILKQSAAWQSADMFAHNTLSHTDSLGRTPDIRLTDCGYNIANGYGESIAEGSASADVVFNAWKKDSSYNQILLNNAYTIAGIDMEQDTLGQNIFWTMDFGSNSPGATTTPTTIRNSPHVALRDQIPPKIGPVATDMLIAVSVKINGIGQDGNVTPKHLTRKVTALIYSTGTSLVTTGTGFLNYDGNNYFRGTIHLSKLSQGSYLVKLISDNALQVLTQPTFQTLLIGKTNILPLATLYQGDLNGDNVLNISDYNIALSCFQSGNCDNTTMDFNDDGVINVLDYNLFLQSFEELHRD